MGIFALLSMQRHTYNEYKYIFSRASLVAHLVKNPPAMRETWIQSLGWEDSWRKAWQPTPRYGNSVLLPGESPQTAHSAGGLQSIGLQRVGHY